MKTKFGVFYHGCHHADHYKKDFVEIAKLFDWVALPMTEWDMRFSEANIVKLVQAAKDAGLSTWLLPWGMAGLFGGEGRWDELLCPFGFRFDAMINRWLDIAVSAKPDFVYWDEPTNKCCQTPFVTELIQRAHSLGLRSTVYLKPYTLETTNFFGASIVGSDLYKALTDKKIEDNVAMVAKRATVLGAQSLVWLQGFRVHSSFFASWVLKGLRAAYGNIDYVGIWGYKNSEAMSILECAYDLWTPLIKDLERLK